MKRTRKPDSRDGWYQLEPGDAQALLDGQGVNRPLRESKALRFASDITDGKWRPNGEPLILDEDGRLVDGQGRCRACVIAGKPIEVYVIYGVPRKFFSTFDTGQGRNGADTLSIAGFKNYAITAAVAKIAVTISRGSGGSWSRPVNNHDIEAWCKKNKARLDAAMEKLQGIWKNSPLQPSMLVYIYMEAAEYNEPKAYEWAKGVCLGENLSAASPMLTLRNRIINMRGELHKARPYERLAWAIKSWNAFIEGRSWKIAKYQSTKSGSNKPETWPEISDGWTDEK